MDPQRTGMRERRISVAAIDILPRRLAGATCAGLDARDVALVIMALQ
jgi:hypothetical protein